MFLAFPEGSFVPSTGSYGGSLALGFLTPGGKQVCIAL
jgi:hypothetical protein